MSISVENFDFIAEFIRSESLIVLEREKTYLVEARLGPLCRREEIPSIDDLCDRLRRDGTPELRSKVVDAMTTNETSFFRDLHPFEALRTTIIPELLEAQAISKKISIWCVSCSSGQEPYSIAMTLLGSMPNIKEWQVSILATDISAEVLEQSQKGNYSQLEINRGLPTKHLVKYFDKNGLRWVLKSEVRQMVNFKYLNLKDNIAPNVPGPFDIIFCRNVLIYFDVTTKQEIVRQLQGLLRADGHLFFGTAESPFYFSEGLTRRVIGKASCYQISKESA